MQIIQQINQFLNNIFLKEKKVKNNISFNNIILQLSEPPVTKVKSPEEIQKHYLIQEALFQLEIDMLRMSPALRFKGIQRWKDNTGNIFFDWVPCVVRPEVLFLGWGKS